MENQVSPLDTQDTHLLQMKAEDSYTGLSMAPPPLQLQASPAAPPATPNSNPVNTSNPTSTAAGGTGGGKAATHASGNVAGNAVAAAVATATPKPPVLDDRPQFGDSNFREEYIPDLLFPLNSAIEEELSRLTLWKQGYAEKGWSEHKDPTWTGTSPDFEKAVEDFVDKHLPSEKKKNKGRMVEIVTKYLEGNAATVPSNPDIEDHVERQHGGYDAMAELIAEHSGRHAKDKWKFQNSPEMMQMLHDMGYWQDLDRRAVNAAEAEYADWTDPDNGLQRSESHKTNKTGNLDKLKAYWTSAGKAKGNIDTAAQNSYDDNGSAWSAAFISHVMLQAGAADTFRYSGGHSYYAVRSKQHETDGESEVTHPSRLLNADNEPVHVGGLIHRNRSSGTGGVTYDTVAERQLTHADIVVDIEIYDEKGVRVTGHYQDIIDQTDASILATYQIFAVTIGGNTADEELVADKSGKYDIEKRDRSEMKKDGDNETVGRRYWKLKTDLKVDNDPIPSLSVYGIQRMKHPPRTPGI
ncbi:MAG: DUF2272 domain-containing protein [Bacteroidota bacterium]